MIAAIDRSAVGVSRAMRDPDAGTRSHDRFERRDQPARWVAHFNLVVAALLIPSAFAGTAMTGPIAWDGLLTFWVRNVAIGLWIIIMAVVLGQAIKRQRAEDEAVLT